MLTNSSHSDTSLPSEVHGTTLLGLGCLLIVVKPKQDVDQGICNGTG